MSRVRSSRSRRSTFSLGAAALALGLSSPVFAQVVDLGATGEDGALLVTEDTVLQVPEDGVIHATEIRVSAGKTLSFTPNAKNTGIILTSIGDVVIDGTITVDGMPGVVGAGGAGGPGGSKGGSPASYQHRGLFPASFGLDGYHCSRQSPESCTPIAGGPGGLGSHINNAAPPGNCTLGSGGGGGGGHLYITSNRSISGAGILSAQGGTASQQKTSCGGSTSGASAAQAGAGGAVTLMAPRLDLAPMTIRLGQGGHLYLRTLEYASNSPIVTGTSTYTSTGSTLVAWRPAPNLAVRITSVNGVPVPPAESLSLTLTGPSTNATVEATGCDRARLVVRLGYLYSSDNSYTSMGSSVTVNSPSQTEETYFDFSTPSPGTTRTFKAFASCTD